jgi:SAM-dependent methyltransferase
MEPDRYKRESEFHDRVFQDESRHGTDRFYSITVRSKAFYRNTLLDAARGSRVLEFGCGPHSHAPLLAQRGAAAFGIDISPVAIRQYRDVLARRGVTEASASVMNAEQLAFPDQSFDVVCGTGILHHLDLRRSYSEIARTLRPTGLGLFIEPMGHNPAINAYRNRTPELRTPDEHPLLVSDLKLAEEYFEKVECRFFHLSTLGLFPLHRTAAFPSLLGAMDRLDQFLFKALPFTRKHAWAVVLQFKSPRRNRPKP